jgi:hypothetical protein
MTYEDLKLIKSKRHRDGLIVTHDFPNSVIGGNSDYGIGREVGGRAMVENSALSKRKYLIVTYSAEFDK